MSLPKYCLVKDRNYDGEIMFGEFNGTFYVLEDGDCYEPDALKHYDVIFSETKFSCQVILDNRQDD